MEGDGHQTLAEYRFELKEVLDLCFTRKDDPDPGKRFARVGITREIFNRQRLTQLFKLLLHGNSLHIGQEAENRLQSISAKIRGSETSSKFCNVLAILLDGRCYDETLQAWVERLSSRPSHDQIADDDLPLTRREAQIAFGREDGLNFWEKQPLFCPVILEEGEESVYVENRHLCPLPWVEGPTPIGQGSYADVYKVKIERRHLVNRSEGLAIDSAKEFAQKVYTGYNAAAKKAFEAEGTTLKKIMEATKSHENILVTKATLERHGTYSLFFDLAKCSLDDYLSDHSVNIASLQEKRSVFGRTVGLAGALAYLHDELFITTTGEQLRCYHLDLKPHNILVFDSNGNDVWKISDFGISQIKRIPSHQQHEAERQPTSFLDRVFRRGNATSDPSSGVTNSRYGGTYSAPEARLASDKVTRKTDVWSLGCVLSLVLTFLDNGSKGVRDFERARSENRDNDRFFEPSSPEATEVDEHDLHEPVRSWLASLVGNAIERHEQEGKSLGEIVDLLQSNMLLVDESSRYSAKEVEHQLRSLHAMFPEEKPNSNGRDRPPERTDGRATRKNSDVEAPPSERRSASQIREGQGNAISAALSPSAQSMPSAEDVPSAQAFPLENDTIRCQFNQRGSCLGLLGANIITTNSVSDFQDQEFARKHVPPGRRLWTDFSLGAAWLCAITDSPYFECVFIPLSTDQSWVEHHVRTRIEKRIRKVVLSPNDEITAFILEESDNDKTKSSLLLYRTEDLLGTSPSSNKQVTRSLHKGEDNTKEELPDDSEQSLSELPWPRIAKNSQDWNLPVTADLISLKFSGHGTTVMAVTKPYKPKDNHIPQYTITTWDTTCGQKLSTLTTKHGRGTQEPFDAWKVSAFAIDAASQSFAAVSESRIRIGTYHSASLQYRNHSRLFSDTILDISPSPSLEPHSPSDPNEARFIIIGREGQEGGISATRTTISQVDSLDHFDTALSMKVKGIGDYDPDRDCVLSIQSDEDAEKQILLIATIDTRKRQGKLMVKPWQ